MSETERGDQVYLGNLEEQPQGLRKGGGDAIRKPSLPGQWISQRRGADNMKQRLVGAQEKKNRRGGEERAGETVWSL